MTDIKTGTGPAIEEGQTAVVHYTGWLYEPSAADGKGRKFDSSRDRGEPYVFRIGNGHVIQGWEEAIPAMKVGEKRTLIVPWWLGYGEAGKGPIPPKATLVFEVELVGIR